MILALQALTTLIGFAGAGFYIEIFSSAYLKQFEKSVQKDIIPISACAARVDE